LKVKDEDEGNEKHKESINEKKIYTKILEGQGLYLKSCYYRQNTKK